MYILILFHTFSFKVLVWWSNTLNMQKSIENIILVNMFLLFIWIDNLMNGYGNKTIDFLFNLLKYIQSSWYIFMTWNTQVKPNCSAFYCRCNKIYMHKVFLRQGNGILYAIKEQAINEWTCTLPAVAAEMSTGMTVYFSISIS